MYTSVLVSSRMLPNKYPCQSTYPRVQFRNNSPIDIQSAQTTLMIVSSRSRAQRFTVPTTSAAETAPTTAPTMGESPGSASC